MPGTRQQEDWNAENEIAIFEKNRISKRDLYALSYLCCAVLFFLLRRVLMSAGCDSILNNFKSNIRNANASQTVTMMITTTNDSLRNFCSRQSEIQFSSFNFAFIIWISHIPLLSHGVCQTNKDMKMNATVLTRLQFVSFLWHDMWVSMILFKLYK